MRKGFEPSTFTPMQETAEITPRYKTILIFVHDIEEPCQYVMRKGGIKYFGEFVESHAARCLVSETRESSPKKSQQLFLRQEIQAKHHPHKLSEINQTIPVNVS